MSTETPTESPPEKWYMRLSEEQENELLDKIKARYAIDIKGICEPDSELYALMQEFKPWYFYRLNVPGDNRPLRIVRIDEVLDHNTETGTEKREYYLQAFATAGELSEELSGVRPHHVVRLDEWSDADKDTINELMCPDLFMRPTGFLSIMQECIAADQARQKSASE